MSQGSIVPTSVITTFPSFRIIQHPHVQNSTDTDTRYILHNFQPELMAFDGVPFRKTGKRALSGAVSGLTVCSMVQPESCP